MGKSQFIDIKFDHNRILSDLAGSEQDVKGAFFDSLKKIHAMKSMDELPRSGLRWEKLEGRAFPGTKNPIYSYRITKNWRAICLLHSGPIIEILWVCDHDDSY
jgi:hypothetical protein